MKRIAICCLLALAASGCSWLWPSTDIVGTTTEDVGYYDVAEAASADTVTATVCADDPGNAVPIASRVAHELYGKGYRTIRFDVRSTAASADGEVTHLTWTPEDQVRVTGRDASATPSAPSLRCDPRAREPRAPAAALSRDR